MLGNATQVTLSGKQRHLDWMPGQRDSEGQLFLLSAVWLGPSAPWSPTAAPVFLQPRLTHGHDLTYVTPPAVSSHTSADPLATWYLQRDGGFA